MNRFRIAYQYGLHFLSARNTRGFGIHSPYVYYFTKFVVNNRSSYYIFPEIERIRKSLKSDKRNLNIVDYGMGSKRERTVATIAKTSLMPAKYGQLLYRLSGYVKARNILELGTSLGITTSYLASMSSQAKCVSLEGCRQIADVATETFNSLGIKNMQIVVGDIDKTLTNVLREFDRLDLIVIDANHRSEAVLNYFEQILTKVHTHSIVVVDDIHWSVDMEEAWKRIKENPQVTSTIDLFQMGIVFFNTDLNKKNYKMRF